MKVSVVISVYNRFKYVENILKCLISQTYLPFEVIFTDDGSSENLKEVLLKYKDKVSFEIKHIYQSDKGFRKAKACNNAFIEAKGDYIISLDQDAIFPNNLIETFMNLKKENYFSILRVVWSHYEEMLNIQKKIDENKEYEEYLSLLNKKHFKKLKKWLIKDKYNNFRYILGLRDRGAGLMGIGFGLFKKDLTRINGYDEDFKGWGGEDADLGFRLYYSGLRSKTFTTKSPSIHMCHPIDPTKNKKDDNKEKENIKKSEVLKGKIKSNYGMDNRKDKDEYKVEVI